MRMCWCALIIKQQGQREHEMECSLSAARNTILAHITGSKQNVNGQEKNNFNTLAKLEMSLQLGQICLLNCQADEHLMSCVHLNDIYEFII